MNGPANMDYRSLFLNYELNLITCDEQPCRQLQAQFAVDVTESAEIVLPVWAERKWKEYLFETIGWLSRRWRKLRRSEKMRTLSGRMRRWAEREGVWYRSGGKLWQIIKHGS